MATKLISLEEHFYSEAVFNSLNDRGKAVFYGIPDVLEKLRDIENDRLESMDKNDIAMQIIAHSWQTDGGDPEACIKGNDELARRIASYPRRFAAFAALAMGHPEASVLELKRTVKEYGFVGALIDNHINGTFYDGPEYDCFWKCAEDLDVPIYIHPALTSDQITTAQFRGNYSETAAFSLANISWGWHADTGLHILRLYAAGVFDRYPKLKIVIGHFGEMLPFMLERCADFSSAWGARHRSIEAVWKENIWITTSGVWSLNPLKCLLGNTRVDHIMFSVDYPFSTNESGRQWFEKLEHSGLLSHEEQELIARGNAERLFKLKI